MTAYAQHPPHGGVFDLFPSMYIPAPNERLGGHSAKSRVANEHVNLLFLIKKDLDVIPRTRREYKAPEHVVYEKPRMYKEMEYQMYPTELRMEFFLKMVDLFCKPRDSMLQIFCGQKLLTAAVVSLSCDAPWFTAALPVFSSIRAKYLCGFRSSKQSHVFLARVELTAA